MSDVPNPIGELAIEREEGAVVLRIEKDEDDEEDEKNYLSPEDASQIAMWLNQAAADAKQWQRHEGSR